MSWKELFWEAFNDLYKLVVWFYKWIWTKIIKPSLWLFVGILAFALFMTIISVVLNYSGIYPIQEHIHWLTSLLK